MLVPVVAALSLGACAQQNAVVVGVPHIDGAYSPQELSAYGSGGNELRVFGTPVTFALKPRQERKPLSRVVVYFNPSQLIGNEGLCSPNSPTTTGPTRDGVVRMAAAWCQTNYEINETTGDVGNATGLDSPPFRELVGQVTTVMFPSRNPHLDAGRRPCPPFCSR
jgi:hypothetical protein